MRAFRENWTRENVAGCLKRQAATGEYNGVLTLNKRLYIDNCKAAYEPDGVIMIFTRDTGHHTSGWWKNPDYERCLHLSLSFRDPKTGQPVERDKKLSSLWVEEFFGATKNLIWVEPPFSPEGKRADVWHYRVFYAPGWVASILPRKEVYSKDWTPAGWLSYSDVLNLEKEQVDTFLNQF